MRYTCYSCRRCSMADQDVIPPDWDKIGSVLHALWTQWEIGGESIPPDAVAAEWRTLRESERERFRLLAFFAGMDVLYGCAAPVAAASLPPNVAAHYVAQLNEVLKHAPQPRAPARAAELQNLKTLASAILADEPTDNEPGVTKMAMICGWCNGAGTIIGPTNRPAPCFVCGGQKHLTPQEFALARIAAGLEQLLVAVQQLAAGTQNAITGAVVQAMMPPPAPNPPPAPVVTIQHAEVPAPVAPAVVSAPGTPMQPPGR